jgi:hypothetical protein
MLQIYGQSLEPSELRRRMGNPRTAAGVRLMTFGDGPERGVRCLEFRNWAGLRFTVLVDRGMDIGDLEWRGVPLGWQSPTGYRGPWLTDSESEDGLGILRAFSGFMVTCGFDHVRRPDIDGDTHFNGSLRPEIRYPLHGRGALQPARLIGYGQEWIDGELRLWCEGEVSQASLFAETIILHRRIEVTGGGTCISVSDLVENAGFQTTSHMQLYHLNLGWPLLDEGSVFLAPVRETVWANVPEQEQAFGCFTQSGPQRRAGQQLFVHRVDPDIAGRVTTALVNAALELGVAVSWPKKQLPWLQQWQCLTEGIYGFGIEPVTNRFGTRRELAAAGEIGMLRGQEQRRYDLAIEVVEGAAGLDALATRINEVSAPRQGVPPRTAAKAP